MFKNPTEIFNIASFIELFCLPDCALDLLEKAEKK